MKLATCVWIENPQGQIVLTSRRNSTLVSLPGGKVDPEDVSIAAAAAREVLEETGIVLSPDALVAVYTEQCGDDRTTNTYLVTTFFIQVPECDIPGGNEEDITSIWGNPDALVANSPFADYNAQAIAAVTAHKHT